MALPTREEMRIAAENNTEEYQLFKTMEKVDELVHRTRWSPKTQCLTQVVATQWAGALALVTKWEALMNKRRKRDSLFENGGGI